MDLINDIPKYKKKSNKKPPKKAKHKHLCEPCVVEYPEDWYLKEHLRSGKTKSFIYGYCPICGKITTNLPHEEQWYERVEVSDDGLIYWTTVPTDECMKELDPLTRTLPTFKTDDCFIKNVKLED